jgi:predicted TIM-barrel fold metal-dependent hydrolase
MHVWDPYAHYYPWLSDERPIAFRYGDYSKLRRRYLVDDYRADTAGWRVSHAVYVEAEWDPRDPLGEMDFVGRIRKKSGLPTVAIAQAWLDRDDCPQVLEAHARQSFVRGVRHKPKPGMMDDGRWREGFARLAPLHLHFELQAPYPRLDEAARLARDFAGTTIVLNHAGLPSSDDARGWRAAMAGLAACPNVAVKISGMGVPVREFVLAAIELFGVERAMFASNYPVDSLRASFTAIYSGFEEITREMPEAQRRALFHDNAVRIYRME